MMRQGRYLAALLLTTASLILAVSPLRAQQPVGVPQGDRWVSAAHRDGKITGEPGSPSATIEISGEKIPVPPQKFGGKIGSSYSRPS